MSDRLKGRVVIVTGSGQGIGKAIAIAMAKEGAKVVTNNRRAGSTGLITRDPILDKLSPERKEWALKQDAKLTGDAETTAKAIRDMGGEAVPVFGNVGDYEVAGNLIKTAVDSFGKVDILVNNAGPFQQTPIWAMTQETWHRVVDAHLGGTWNCIRHVAPLMKEQKWGRIINCTSNALLGQKYGSNYSASKGGILSLTMGVAKDLWEFGITCNAYAPMAMTRAILTMAIHDIVTDESFEAGAGPEPVAPFVVYLATDEAANISGSTFSLQGGHIGLLSEPADITALDRKEGIWTVDELIEQAPKVLLKGYKSKAPAVIGRFY